MSFGRFAWTQRGAELGQPFIAAICRVAELLKKTDENRPQFGKYLEVAPCDSSACPFQSQCGVERPQQFFAQVGELIILPDGGEMLGQPLAETYRAS